MGIINLHNLLTCYFFHSAVFSEPRQICQVHHPLAYCHHSSIHTIRSRKFYRNIALAGWRHKNKLFTKMILFFDSDFFLRLVYSLVEWHIRNTLMVFKRQICMDLQLRCWHVAAEHVPNGWFQQNMCSEGLFFQGDIFSFKEGFSFFFSYKMSVFACVRYTVCLLASLNLFLFSSIWRSSRIPSFEKVILKMTLNQLTRNVGHNPIPRLEEV